MNIEASGGTVHWLEAPGHVRIRAAHWPVPAPDIPRGTVLLLNGRTEFIEKYLEPIAELQSRGFAVWTLDWRGQGLSSRHTPDPHAHYIEHFDHYLEDLSRLHQHHIQPTLQARPLLLMAHSMGGHIAARALARHPARFARAILCAPMIDFLRHGPLPSWAVPSLVRLACLRPGHALRYAPGGRPYRPAPPFEGNKLTTCPLRYAADAALVAANPGLELGGVTWGWVRAALASIATLRRPATIDRITMPVLVAIAGDEQIVDNRAIRAFTRRLPHGKLLTIEGARHELLREQDHHRTRLWSAIDQFLEPLE